MLDKIHADFCYLSSKYIDIRIQYDSDLTKEIFRMILCISNNPLKPNKFNSHKH